MKRVLLNMLPDRLYLKLRYYRTTGTILNLTTPVTFTEKLQWLKLYDRKPNYSKLVDKYDVKEYVRTQLGEKYVIPTLGIWNKYEDIDFEKLPKCFVLKCTHDSGGTVLCRNKDTHDWQSSKKKLNNSLKTNYYYSAREWPYKNVKPRILAEQMMVQEDEEDLTDYKFYCFEGKPVYCQVIKNRNHGESIDFFDMDWKKQNFTGITLPHLPHYKGVIKKPNTFEEMKECAEKLAKGIPFVRIDLYEISGQVYFGEYTFFPAGGFGRFEPECWNKTMGDLIPIKKREKV